MNISPILTAARLFVSRNSTTILTAVAAAGVVTTGILAAKASPVARSLVVDEVNRRWVDGGGPQPPSFYDNVSLLDQAKLTWKVWAPPVLSGALTITALIFANRISVKRQLVLASAYSMSEATLKEYQDKVIEEIGPKKEAKIHEEIAQDRLDKAPLSQATVIKTGKGDTICYDSMTGRYFTSDLEFLRKAQNNLNQRLINGTWLSLNELYTEIGLEEVKMGDDLGWIPDNLLELKFTAKLADDGTPCLVMDYYVDPKIDYYRT